MSYRYPLDVQELLRHARARGPHFLETTGLDRALPDDVVLGRLARKAGTGWFPYTASGVWHPALDVGMSDWEQDSIAGLRVVAVADGVVAYVDPHVRDERGRCLGRLIVEHRAPDGTPFHVQYACLEEIGRYAGEAVREGAVLGKLGRYGTFPHLALGVATLLSVGGESLAPDADHLAAAPLHLPWDALRVRIPSFDRDEWPVKSLAGHAGYLYDPVEFVRWCRGDPRQDDAGPASTHDARPLRGAVAYALGPGTDHVLEAATAVRSACLRIPEIEELVRRRAIAPPVGPGDGRIAVVTAIQQALRDAGFARFAATGTYGAMTVDAVKTFQRDKLRSLLAGEPSPIPGKKPADAPEDGKVDWLTLVGLDVYADQVARAPKPVRPKSDADSNEEAPPVAPAAPENTFDSTQGVSVRMGARMIQAMLPWLWHGDWDAKAERVVPARDPRTGAELPMGVGYSTTVPAHYGTAEEMERGLAVLPRELSVEWPDVRLESAKSGSITVDGYPDPIPTYRCWGLTWKGTGYTNCCNSLLAALAVALGGRTFGVKGGREFGRPRGETVTAYDMVQVARPQARLEDSRGKVIEQPALKVFEAFFVTSDTYAGYRSAEGARLVDYGRYGGHVCAVEALGIGKALQRWTRRTNREGFLQLRIGDLMASATDHGGHAFLAADVRYGVWVKRSPAAAAPGGEGKGARGQVQTAFHPGPHYFLDQSSFIEREVGELVPLSAEEAHRDARSFPNGRPPLTPELCAQLATAEGAATLERRIAAFLARAELGGEQVVRVEVLCWRQLSANGTVSAAHSRPYTSRPKTEKEMDADEEAWKAKLDEWEKKKEKERKDLAEIKDEKVRAKRLARQKAGEEAERRSLNAELVAGRARKVFVPMTSMDFDERTDVGGIQSFVRASGITLPWQDDSKGRKISFGRLFGPLANEGSS